MVIKIDIDGVIRDMVSTMCNIYNREYHDHITPDDVTEYDVDKIFTKCGGKAAEYFFDNKGVFVNRYSPIFDGAAEAIDKLRDAGHKIVIVSWQPLFDNKIDTLHFLKANKVHYDDIAFTKDKDSIKGDILIDDNPEFIEQCNDKEITFLINRPYNVNVDVKCTRRFDSLAECVDYLNYENN